MPKYRYRVDIIESEAGWGQKIEGTRFFEENEEDKAIAFVEDYNKDNNLPQTPSYYWYATTPRKVMVDN